MEVRGWNCIPLIELTDWPPYYTPSKATCGPITDIGLIALQNFLSAAFERYEDAWWQIGNEMDWILKDPNIDNGGGFGGGCLGQDPGTYINLIRAAASVRKNGNKILLAALSSDDCFDSNQLPIKTEFSGHFWEEIRREVEHLVDKVCFNHYFPYRNSHRFGPIDGLLGKVQRFDTYKPIIITESGYEYTNAPGSTWMQKSKELAKVVTYNICAAHVANLEALVHFAIQNGKEEGNRYGVYGLFLSTGERNYAGDAYRNTYKFIRGYERAIDLSEPVGKNTLRHYLFKMEDGLEHHVLMVDSGNASPGTSHIEYVQIPGILSAYDCYERPTSILEGERIAVGDTPEFVITRPRTFIPMVLH